MCHNENVCEHIGSKKKEHGSLGEGFVIPNFLINPGQTILEERLVRFWILLDAEKDDLLSSLIILLTKQNLDHSL